MGRVCHRRTLVASRAIAALLVVLASSAAWAAPRARCAAERAGSRALVTVALTDLFDEDLLRLVRLGLTGTIHLEATLLRRRTFWFDDRRATIQRDVVVSWDRTSGTFVVDGQALPTLAELTVPALPVRPTDGPLGLETHHVDVTARLEVVTASSLGQVARWLAQGTTAGEGTQALPRSVLSYLAADLARSATGRCPLR